MKDMRDQHPYFDRYHAKAAVGQYVLSLREASGMKQPVRDRFAPGERSPSMYRAKA